MAPRKHRRTGNAPLVLARADGQAGLRFQVRGQRLRGQSRADPTDGFHEFTEQVPKAKLKHKWLVEMIGHSVFMIAGTTRTVPRFGEPFTMLTTEPGPDIAPYHSRQIVVLGRDDWARWFDPKVSPADVLRPAPAGTLKVTQVR